MLILGDQEDGGINDDLTFIAIDPGTDHLGVAILRMCAHTHALMVDEALTFVASKATKHTPLYKNIAAVHGALYGRLAALRRSLDEVIEEHRPDLCCSESPFLGASIDGYAKLTEAVQVVRQAIIARDIYTPMYLIPPQTMKKAIGALAQTETKESVLPAIKVLVGSPEKSGLYLADHIDLDQLSEHAVDAIGVGYTQYMEFRSIDDLIEESTHAYPSAHQK